MRGLARGKPRAKGKETLVQEGERRARSRPPLQGGDTFLPHPRNKSGIWGWRSEKMEVVSGYEAKVGTAGDTGDTPSARRG